jgi:hypothetical protein
MDILSRDRWDKDFQKAKMMKLYGYILRFTDKLKCVQGQKLKREVGL